MIHTTERKYSLSQIKFIQFHIWVSLLKLLKTTEKKIPWNLSELARG
jgi:hypothetical protein